MRRSLWMTCSTGWRRATGGWACDAPMLGDSWVWERLGVAVFVSEVIIPFLKLLDARGGFRVTGEGGSRTSAILQRNHAARKNEETAASKRKWGKKSKSSCG